MIELWFVPDTTGKGEIVERDLPASGDISVTPKATGTYVIVVDGPGGRAIAAQRIAVLPNAPAPKIGFRRTGDEWELT